MRFKYIFVVYFLLSLYLIDSASPTDSSQRNSCRRETIHGRTSLVCTRLDAFNLTASQANEEPIENVVYELERRNQRAAVLATLDFDALIQIAPFTLTFYNLEGIELNSVGLKLPLKGNKLDTDSYSGFNEIQLIDSKIDSYSHGQVSCSKQVDEKGKSLIRYSFLSVLSFSTTSLTLSNVDYRRKVCPLLFQDVQIFNIILVYMQNSFYRRNFIQFDNDDPDLNELDFGLTIDSVEFIESHNIEMTSRVLDPRLFASLKQLTFEGTLDSIEPELFPSLKSLRNIDIYVLYLRRFLHKSGIEWIRGINRDLRVDLNNPAEIGKHASRIVEVYVIENAFIEQSKIKKLDGEFREFTVFNDEDLCLFREFPFEQLVVLESYFEHPRPTCTILWLIRFYPKFAQLAPEKYINLINNYTQFIENQSFLDACDFSKRFQLCNRTDFKRHETHVNDWFQRFIFLNFIQLLLTPVICLFGLITNILVVLVVRKHSKSDLKTKQYSYMKMNAVCNILVLAINLFGLINECQYPFGLFCSSVRENKLVQIYKIAAVEFLGNSLKSVSNFSYIAFSINRLLLVGKDHMPYLKQFSADYKKLLKYVVLVVTFSLMNGVVRVVQYDMRDSLETREFPSLFIKDMYYFTETRDDGEMKSHVKFKLVLTFKVVCDFINNILFILLNTLIDLVLLVKLKRLLDKKLVNSKDQKLLKERIILKTSLMVVIYALSNCVLKLPMIVLSFNDLVLIFRKDYLNYNGPVISSEIGSFNKSHLFKSVCVFDHYCTILEYSFNLLVLVSLSINFFFYYCFDKRFRNCCRELLFGKKRNNNERTPFSRAYQFNSASFYEPSSSSF